MGLGATHCVGCRLRQQAAGERLAGRGSGTGGAGCAATYLAGRHLAHEGIKHSPGLGQACHFHLCTARPLIAAAAALAAPLPTQQLPRRRRLRRRRLLLLLVGRRADGR